jgi:hypothetical protein
MTHFASWGTSLVGTLLLLACSTRMGLTVPLLQDEKSVPVVVQDPPQEPRNQGRLSFDGFVTAIDKESITITWEARRSERYGYGPDGKWGLQKIIINKAQPPRKFVACEALAAGKFKRHPLAGPEATYRLTDVSVGDSVWVGYIRLNGVDIAEDICITRRPGGLVPPAPGEDPKEPDKWHDRRNAYEFLITKGVTVLPKLALQMIR